MKKNVKICFIGLGRRGLSLFDSCFTEISDVEITTICDIDSNTCKSQVENSEI